jgi:hypothetical protein
MKALAIREPWISYIPSGSNTWEMRSSRTDMRGRIGLIRKDSGMVADVAEPVDSLSRLDPGGLTTGTGNLVRPNEHEHRLGGIWHGKQPR